MKKRGHVLMWSAALSVALGVSGIFFLLRRVFDLTVAPVVAKACDFIYPFSEDQTKLTTLYTRAAEAGVDFAQRGGLINDASCLNKTAVYGIVHVQSEEDIRQAIVFAEEHGIPITPAGERHSMGGQSFVRDGLVLDMHALNQIDIDAEHMTMRVRSGARWKDVQERLDAQGLSVKAMQSINTFTIGGTLSVNAHGIAHNPGQVAPTVRSIRVMTAGGEVVTASPTENTELFRHVLGGYGLFGVILDAEFDIVSNELYDWQTTYVEYTDFPAYYAEHIEGNSELGLAFGRLSIAPGSGYLKETAVHTFVKTPTTESLPVMQPDTHTDLQRFVINFSKTGGVGRWLRWNLEKTIVPDHSGSCLTRNQAMSQKEVCIVTRNQLMHDSMGYLQNRLPDTDILQEYFIPHDKMPEFVDGLRQTVQTNGANLLNVTIRIVHEDNITAMPYAPGERFAFVLYFNQKYSIEDAEILQKTTTDLIDVATKLGGSYYLPYQLFYSPEQLRAAYPNTDDFFTTKRLYDPQELFTNTFYEKYGRM